MALKKPYQSKFGILVPDAYFKVASVSGSKLGAIITVDVYASDEASKSGSRQVDSSALTSLHLRLQKLGMHKPMNT